MSSVGNPRRNARKRKPPATRRRALELLAASRDGCTEAIMLAHAWVHGRDAGRPGTRRACDRDGRAHGRRRTFDGGRACADYGGGAAGARGIIPLQVDLAGMLGTAKERFAVSGLRRGVRSGNAV